MNEILKKQVLTPVTKKIVVNAPYIEMCIRDRYCPAYS